MKGMVFAAGLGTRLYPLTASCPKALVDVCGTPMLARVIRKLISAGVDDLVVNVHHFPDMIIDYLAKNDNFGVSIRVSDERDLLLDTGGGLQKAASLFGYEGPVVVHNADIFTDFDLRPMIESHMRSDDDATLLVSGRKTSRYLLFDSESRMRGWVNRSTGEVRPCGVTEDALAHKAFGGVHVVSGRLLRKLAENAGNVPYSITPFYIDRCNELKISAYEPSGSYAWFDIGKPETLESCRRYVSEGDIS
ncbi:MAG: nucleotidyltransferase family protein [Paramuribaculum sp.]|nr:nucleotidyltransferase family protein [Paramuribaculum sp.]